MNISCESSVHNILTLLFYLQYICFRFRKPLVCLYLPLKGSPGGQYADFRGGGVKCRSIWVPQYG